MSDFGIGSSITASLDRSVDRSLVRVDYDPSDPLCNDLVTCLTNEYLKANGMGGPKRTIELAADVIAFNLRRKQPWPSGNSPLVPFNFPSHFFLDRFMSESHEISEKIFQSQKMLNESIDKLETERKTISMFEVR